jgi:hypothetical protein
VISGATARSTDRWANEVGRASSTPGTVRRTRGAAEQTARATVQGGVMPAILSGIRVLDVASWRSCRRRGPVGLSWDDLVTDKGNGRDPLT